MILVNDLNKTADQVKGEFKDTFIEEGVLRWTTNGQIPFEDMLADFRTLGLIDEDVQLYSNLLREKQTDEFWSGYFNQK